MGIADPFRERVVLMEATTKEKISFALFFSWIRRFLSTNSALDEQLPPLDGLIAFLYDDSHLANEVGTRLGATGGAIVRTNRGTVKEQLIPDYFLKNST